MNRPAQEKFAKLCRFLQRLVEGLRIQREQTLQKSASFKDGSV
jgi:hypothetical protein